MERIFGVVVFFILVVITLLFAGCGGGGGEGSGFQPPPTVVVDPDADYSVMYLGGDGRPTTIGNGQVSLMPNLYPIKPQDAFGIMAQKTNIKVYTLVFRLSGEYDRIASIYFMYMSPDGLGSLILRAEMYGDGVLLINFDPDLPLIVEVGGDFRKTLIEFGYNIMSSDLKGESSFALEFDGTDDRNRATDFSGLMVRINGQIITTPGHIICPQVTPTSELSC